MVHNKAPGGPDDASGAGRSDRAAAKDGAPRQRDLKDYIGRQLRALYDDVVNQPVPDRFKELLDRLDEKTRDE
jgi:hypothetical protein